MLSASMQLHLQWLPTFMVNFHKAGCSAHQVACHTTYHQDKGQRFDVYAQYLAFVLAPIFAAAANGIVWRWTNDVQSGGGLYRASSFSEPTLAGSPRYG